MDRRTFLATTAAGLGGGLAGCTGSGEDGTTAPGTTSPPGGGGLPDHAAVDGIQTQPYLGPPPGEAPGTIVAFEDPSCPTCAAFDFRVVPEITSNLVEPGRATFVLRGYPVIYPWGEPASHALEAVYEADAAAVWDLLAHYFDVQREYEGTDPAGVYDMTETFLAEETDLDATAVVDRARAGGVEDAVRTDLDAGKAAGAGRTTPHLFLFSDGEYLTKAAGSISYRVIESTLGV